METSIGGNKMKKADLVIFGDAIFDGISEQPFQGGIAVLGNKIVAVSQEKKNIQEWIDDHTIVLNYDNKLVMPGFVDAHMHLFTGGIVNSKYMLTELFEARSEDDCAKMVARFAAANPDLKKISGMGWFPGIWDDPLQKPTRKSLDLIVPDRPVYLLSADCHTFWLNTKALEECGINKDTTVSFGEIGKDKHGELDGLLYEIEACAAPNEKAFTLPKELMADLQAQFYMQLISYGITSTTNMSVSPVIENTLTGIEVAAEMEAKGELPIRIHFYPSLGLDGDMTVAKELRAKYYSDRLRFSGLKQFVDGVTSTYTAFLLEPYSDNSGVRGRSNYPYEIYEKGVVAANKEGIGVRLHAIGDGAVRMALDAFDASLEANGAHRCVNTIEHIEVIHPDDIGRFSKLNVVASMQPMHLIMDQNEQIVRIGTNRGKYAWPHHTILESGAKLAFGTDYPVADINPFPNIFAAVERMDEYGTVVGINPEEKVTLTQALKAYTNGSASAIGRDSELGTLEEGKLADIIVLDRNLFQCGTKQIADTTVETTIMDGEIVFKK
jgi:predicted amidohydrolase YtcJ